MRCFSSGRSATTRCRNSAVSSRSRSGDSTPLTTTLRAMVCRRASSSAVSSRPVNTTTGVSARTPSSLSRSKTSKPEMSGSRRSSTTQSAGSALSRSRASAPDPTVSISISSKARSAPTLSCSAGLSSTTRRRLRRGWANALILASASSRPSVVVGLLRNEKAPRARPCCLSSSRVMI